MVETYEYPVRRYDLVEFLKSDLPQESYEAHDKLMTKLEDGYLQTDESGLTYVSILDNEALRKRAKSNPEEIDFLLTRIQNVIDNFDNQGRKTADILILFLENGIIRASSDEEDLEDLSPAEKVEKDYQSTKQMIDRYRRTAQFLESLKEEG